MPPIRPYYQHREITLKYCFSVPMASTISMMRNDVKDFPDWVDKAEAWIYPCQLAKHLDAHTLQVVTEYPVLLPGY